MQEKPKTEALQEIVTELGGRRVDLLLWVDRMDNTRVDPVDIEVPSRHCATRVTTAAELSCRELVRCL